MDASLFLAAVVCLLTIFFLRRLFTQNNLAPGPIGLPIVGYIPFLSRNPHFDFQQLAKTYGNVFSLRLGSAYVVILNDFESTREALAQDAFIGRPPNLHSHLNKETIETKAFNGLPWKEQRRFALHMLRDLGLGKSKMEVHIREEISDLLEYLEQNCDKPFCINDLLASSMSNNIASLVFGKRFTFDDPIRLMMNRVLKETSSSAGQITWQSFLPRFQKIRRFLSSGGVDELTRIRHDLKAYVKKEVKEHEETLNPNDIRDYIDGYLLEIEKRKEDPSFCKPVLEDMVGSFFGAGSETVRLSLEWLLLTVATHEDAQHRIQREIDDIIERTQLPTWPHHKSMPYTEAFIMELVRWRTIIPLNIMKYALTDGKVRGYVIPKGSQLMANLWAIHHDPEYWGQDADEFRPERFLTDDGQEVKKWEHYIPFSIGKRACPGEPLANVEVFLYFTSILQKFDVRLPAGKVADFEGKLGIGLIPKQQELIFAKRK